MKIITLFGKRYLWNYEKTSWYKALCVAAAAGLILLACLVIWILLCGAAACEAVI